MIDASTTVLPRAEWDPLSQAHAERADALTARHRQRSGRRDGGERRGAGADRVHQDHGHVEALKPLAARGQQLRDHQVSPGRETTAGAPRGSALAHKVSRLEITKSRRPLLCPGRPLRSSPRSASSRSMSRRVAGDTPLRPLSTLETVGSENSAAAAISAIVTALPAIESLHIASDR